MPLASPRSLQPALATLQPGRVGIASSYDRLRPDATPARFGRSSERIDQLELVIGDLEEAKAEHQARQATAPSTGDPPPAKTGAPRPRGRQPLPAHLPRERVVHAPACACPVCGGTRLTRLGEDEREVLEYVSSHFKVVAVPSDRQRFGNCALPAGDPASTGHFACEHAVQLSLEVSAASLSSELARDQPSARSPRPHERPPRVSGHPARAGSAARADERRVALVERSPAPGMDEKRPRQASGKLHDGLAHEHPAARRQGLGADRVHDLA